MPSPLSTTEISGGGEAFDESPPLTPRTPTTPRIGEQRARPDPPPPPVDEARESLPTIMGQPLKTALRTSPVVGRRETRVHAPHRFVLTAEMFHSPRVPCVSSVLRSAA